jgi:predicted HNH restriction endonuclease/predicted RNA-binding protein with PUA-like domain
MDERIAKIISGIKALEDLRQFELNARDRNALTPEIEDAIKAQAALISRSFIAERTELDLSDLSPAEAKIVEAVSEYVGVMRMQGKDATRTLTQIRNRGLLGAAEAAVARATPTQGFQTLADADRADLSYEQIIVDHPTEFSPRALWYSRRTLGLPNATDKPPAPTRLTTDDTGDDGEQPKGRNPAWSRDELILALDLYLRFRPTLPTQESTEVAELSAFLAKLGRKRALTDAATFRNANGVYMKLNNFRRFDPDYTAAGRVGLSRGNRNEEVVWNEFFSNRAALAEAVAAIRAGVDAEADDGSETAVNESPYWVFVCNPKKWAIDRFLDRRVEHDTWGVRPSDRERFAPGQLGIVRVGVDRRSVAERDGSPPLEPGIYALCEVESEAYPGNGASDEFWAAGEAREPGWPTVKIRYVKTYDRPLTIERLRTEAPGLSPLLLNGFQAASFPVSAADFRTVMALLNEDLDDLASPTSSVDTAVDKLAAMEQLYLKASPEMKQTVSKTIERGPIGNLVKKINGHRCQICEALGLNPIGFRKPNGEPYVEAHHAMPVAKKEIGSLSASNVMTVCPNHHRQLHYGGIVVVIGPTAFDLTIDGTAINIPKVKIGKPPESEAPEPSHGPIAQTA